MQRRRVHTPAPRIAARIAPLAIVAALAVAAAPASAAKAVKYQGKTSSGHKIVFTLKKNRLYNMESGIAVSCISIQGGGSPLAGADTFSYKGFVPLSGKPVEFSFEKTPAFHYNEVTVNHQLSSRINPRTKLISGTQRMQYSFLIPKYPIGTFTIYSCLGEGKFRAKPVVKKRG